ncbi:LEAF RUST 10 DISEASE-RESISTANCE LOCUS RECEPTOR-LIKE PROTEIN KINASE-like 1.1 isoform X1 [Raphanus sativus]|uniref:non-specific serine/threonine protein kinase n=1 Tax=Raphanus sativus TaxID=3726 RepID=A0A6J0MEK8_RAPSA|nr:LEAF RUST 10 DISEASE-RESISTANCE LOCUS RECEPTOR-LIKE PROTEIN KINASE-like 1.1 isoform X1 [Raphanus sativus]
MKTISVLVFFFLIFLMAEAQSKNRTGCAETFSCGSLDFSFPFYNTSMPSRCGLFKLQCTDYQITEIQLEEKGEWYKVTSVSQANTITVTDPRLNRSLETGSCSDVSNFSLPDSPWINMTTLYKCNNSRENGFTFANCKGGGSSLYYSELQDNSGCSAIKTPESWVNPSHMNQSILNATFSLHIDLPEGCYRCHRQGGECTMVKEEFRCLGRRGGRKGPNYYQDEKLKIGLGIGGSLILIIVMMIIVALIVRVRVRKTRKSDWNAESVEAVVMLKRYSYAKVKKMTNSFAQVLGKGGFGTVYKGKLPDGGVDVAVKILKEGKGTGEEFINEVASMSRTSHVNIVSLLGFCYEGNKRAIVYEFMPNGSLDKFISENMSTKIEWERLYDIMVGVSRGLEYLHNRCVSRIVHFDIKPQNILMDKDLCPKIADFGHAKLCKNKESAMSMLDARGTVGYIAPEVFNNNFGGVSHKSDVYSYGMVILEMIGAKNIENCEEIGIGWSMVYSDQSF